MTEIDSFNLRVYALIFNNNNQVLISDEVFKKFRMTKFPGGGMHFGEGTVDCIKREAVEEFGQEVDVMEHVYTTDCFVPTMFFPNKQLIAVYYRASFKEEIRFKVSVKPFDFNSNEDGAQSVRWVKIDDLTSESFTFETDKKVAEMVTEKYSRIHG